MMRELTRAVLALTLAALVCALALVASGCSGYRGQPHPGATGRGLDQVLNNHTTEERTMTSDEVAALSEISTP